MMEEGGQSFDDAVGNDWPLISPSVVTDAEPNPSFSRFLLSFILGPLF